jgi:hypothetical protein
LRSIGGFLAVGGHANGGIYRVLPAKGIAPEQRNEGVITERD